ncbi:MAG: HAD-IA family hydrolase [Comamonas sp.]|uniref:HAD-IA family hydrolase n=1 Tax=Comamonas sp. TaxID=34028 RepID=UPI002FC5CB18
MTQVVLFDFDNTIANTDSIREIREQGAYHLLNQDTLSSVRTYEPVLNLLTTIKSKGYQIGLITNSAARYVSKVIEHLEIEHLFDSIITYTEVGTQGKKPSPKGILLALESLGIQPSPSILYIGDENTDHEAAYKAGITPVMPSWATLKPVSIAPAIELSSNQIIEYLDNPNEFKLFAEKCSELKISNYPRNGVYFLPIDDSANVVTVRGQMASFCLGRYYSQKNAITATLHDNHSLSKEIQKKEIENPFVIPDHWPSMFAHVIKNGASYFFNQPISEFDVVTVIPGKNGKDPRLERLLTLIENIYNKTGNTPIFIPNLFWYLADAASQKTLNRRDRSYEADRALHLNPETIGSLIGKNVLIIDDVTTTGSTMKRARALALSAGASTATGVVLAKTVSVMEDERPCPVCERPMVVRRNPNTGVRFWGCTGFYDEENQCVHTEQLFKKNCPECTREMRIQTNRKTQVKFWSCTGWNQNPSCNNSMDINPNEMPT